MEQISHRQRHRQRSNRVLIAMSGGIDSSVAAMVLLERGYELMGCTFTTGCQPKAAVEEAQRLAERLHIEHHVVDLSVPFRCAVMDEFVSEYIAGRTPNPCVTCNHRIKWGELMKVADAYDCPWIATGHYARISAQPTTLNPQPSAFFLRRAADVHKDQTYFLWRLSSDCLSRTLFPLGDMTKQQVRDYAREHGFESLSAKAESQEICFISDNDYRRFLQQEGVTIQRGSFVDASGKVLGSHAGYQNFTIGQRKGLGIALGEPAFVTHIDALTNRVTLGRHDDLLTTKVPLTKAVFRGDASRMVMAQIRYRSQPTAARIVCSEADDACVLHFEEPVWAVTPGQSAVIYQDDLLVGGGCIF